MWRSVSTKRCSVSSEASSIGVWDVPSPSTILAIGLSFIVAFSPCLHARMREARAHLELLTGCILVGYVRRQHDCGRAHALMDGVNPGRRLVFFDQRLGGAHQTMARHDDAVVSRDQVLLGAVDDRTHQLLNAGVLHRKTGDAAV